MKRMMMILLVALIILMTNPFPSEQGGIGYLQKILGESEGGLPLPLPDDSIPISAIAGLTDGTIVVDTIISRSSVTQHEGALSIEEAQIVDGDILARLKDDETIEGLWSFENALGFKTDIISERTAGVGVTVDGLLIKDAGIPESAVTDHEAALIILESQITDANILARIADAETIEGSWIFSSPIDFQDAVTGIALNEIENLESNKTFVMTTRELIFLWTAPSGHPMTFEARGAYSNALIHVHQHIGNPGVGTHLLHLESEDIDVHHILSESLSATIHSYAAEITGDSEHRFVIQAGGTIQWGPGNAALDTALNRSGVNALTFNGASVTMGALTAAAITGHLLRRDTSILTDPTIIFQNLDDTAATLHTILQRYQFSTTAPATVTAAEWVFSKIAEWDAVAANQNTQASLYLRGGASGLVEVLKLLGSDKSVTIFGDFTVSGTPTAVVRNLGTVSLFGTDSDHRVVLIRNETGVANLADIAARPAATYGYGLIVGHSTSIGTFGTQGAKIESHMLSGGNYGAFYYANDAGAARITGAKSRSGIVGNPGTVVQDGDQLFYLLAMGDDGTDLQTIAAAIRFDVDGAPGANDIPGNILLRTAIGGSLATRWKVVNIGDFLPEASYDLGGTSNYVQDLYIQRLHHVADTEILSGSIADGHVASLRLDPAYTAAIAAIVDRHNFIEYQNPSGEGVGPASITDAPIARFDAAAGVHKSLRTYDVKINIDGSLAYIPFHDGTTLTLPVEIAHTGPKFGLFGVTPVVQPPAYTPTNVTPDRSFDADATTLDEIADVLGTLIADIQSLGGVQ